MRDCTYILSDVHLDDSPASLARERELVAWFASIEDNACRIILLGDIFDFWFTYRRVVPRGHSRLLGKLALMADSGIEIHYFIGNHDMWVFDYFEKEIGMVMHSNPCNMEINGLKIFIGHGDGLGCRKGPYPILKRIFRNRLNQRLFTLLPSRFSFWIALKWSQLSRKSHGDKYKVYLGDDNEDLIRYCNELDKQRHYDYIIFGHRHLAMTKTLASGCRYINVGDWMEHRDYVVIQGTEATLVTS